MRRTTAVLGLVWLCFGHAASGADSGSIEGRFSVTGEGAFSGAKVLLEETGETTLTDVNGRFSFSGVEPGTYKLAFSFDDHRATESGVLVEAGGVANVTAEAEWDIFYMEVITVRAASRRQERITDAPNAATKLSAAEVEKQAVAGQLPRSLRFTPGAELTQSGLYDFNLNTRGFNTAVNRRVLTMIDWRDSSVPAVLGYQDWSTLSVSLNDIESIEFVRGPGAALYGPGAFNGVLDIRTRSPRDDPGGRVSVALGDLDTQRYEAKYAGDLGDGWYYKVQGGYQSSDDFTRSRVGSVEYAPGQLPQELLAPRENREYWFASARLDRYLEGNRHFLVELGTSTAKNFVTVTQVGRSQASRADRPWGRVLYSTPNWNFSAYYTGSDADDLISLGAGNSAFLDSHNMGAELQGNYDLAEGRGRLVVGASIGSQEVDSANPQGFHTVYSQVEDADRWAAFSQADFDFTETLTGVLSVRYDDSSLHDGQISPRAALVWKALPNHTFRLSYSDAFQRPSLTEIHLNTPVAPPIDLSLLEASLAPVLGGVPLGFENIPVLGLGNQNLSLEDVRSFELGWKAIIGQSVFLEASYFWSEISNFTSNLLPNVGTSLGRLNSDYGPYAPPSELTPVASATVLGALGAALPPELLATMSNDTGTGLPIFAAASFGNFGEAETQGLEAGLNYEFANNWRLDFSFSYLDVDIKQNVPENPLKPNAPSKTASAGVFFDNDRWDWALRYRWVDGFAWSAGIFVGDVQNYGTADFYANLRLNDKTRIGLEAANIFDSDHYELFGGDLLKRRIMVYISYSW